MKLEKTREGNKVYPKTINAFFDQKYGKKGTPGRKEFEQKAEAYMIAELIKESRKKAQLTQAQLAARLNVKRTYISKIERASSDIRISTLRKIVETGLGGKLHIHVEL
jgi:ribosome-binding protein aMBF1 (putative translation factor)